MFALARAPTRIYNTIKKTDESKSSRGGRHWRQHSGRTVHRQNFAMSPKEPTDDTVKIEKLEREVDRYKNCLLYTSPSPRDMRRSRMPSSA